MRIPRVSTRLVHPILSYLRANHPKADVDAFVRASGLPVESLEEVRWIEHPRFESMLEALTSVAKDEDEIRAAFSHRFAEAFGIVRWAISATKADKIYQLVPQAMRLLSPTSKMRVESITDCEARLVYESPLEECRAACLGRQAHLELLPTICGLRPAMVVEESCASRGGKTCTYVVRWRGERRGTALAAGAGLAALALGVGVVMHAPLVGALGAGTIASLATAWSAMRVARRQRRSAESLAAAVAHAADDEAQLRNELLAFDSRQRKWTELVERDIDDRTRALRSLVERVGQLQQARVATLLGWSHDLRNPMFVLRVGTDWLAEHRDELPPGAREIVDEQRDALERMQVLLSELMRDAAGRTTSTHAHRVRLDSEEVAGGLLRRLRAFTIRRDVDVDVVVSPTAPARFTVDLLLFDRVIDNLLSNAAKYAKDGSIVVELRGEDRFLIVEVADTGKGLDEATLRRIREPGSALSPTAGADSYGVGLSVVHRLLADVGGRLEIDSTEGQGTSFVAYFPTY
jgi:signal transduction histidine kinase